MPANPKPPKPIRDAAYKRSAANRVCAVSGCYDNETVVLAHIRMPENSGTGLKPPDDESLFLCHHHHDEFDGRLPDGVYDYSKYQWLVRNILIPQRKAAYQEWRAAEVARRAGR